MPSIGTTAEALELLRALGAPPRLVRHHELVVEAAEVLVSGLRPLLGTRADLQRVLLGAALHDVGKINHPTEMSVPGNAHERDGEALLLARGVEPSLARFCWTDMELEDLLVAAADKLWRGKRDDGLEQRLVEALGVASGRPGWDVFSEADEVFAAVAADGDERLARSQR